MLSRAQYGTWLAAVLVSGIAICSHGAENDPAVDAVLGRTSRHYDKHGFKEFALGAPFEEIAKKVPLTASSPNNAAVFMKEGDDSQQFVFTKEGRLVIITRAYEGTVAEYTDSVKQMFGPSFRDPIVFSREWYENDVINGTQTDGYLQYAFPEVLALVYFTSGKENGRNFGRVYINVCDRKWAEDLLNDVAREERKVVEWATKAVQAISHGDVPVDDAPMLPGTRAIPWRPQPYLWSIDMDLPLNAHHVIDANPPETEKRGVALIHKVVENRLRASGLDEKDVEARARCAHICTIVRPEVNVDLDIYPGTRGEGHELKFDEKAAETTPPYLAREPLIIRLLIEQLDIELLKAAFVPRGDVVQKKWEDRGNTIAEWYQWEFLDRNKKVWRVRTRSHKFRLEYLGGKDL